MNFECGKQIFLILNFAGVNHIVVVHNVFKCGTERD